jgi:hypothetical protein
MEAPPRLRGEGGKVSDIPSYKHPTSVQVEPNRLIRCQGSDTFGRFTCEGMFIPKGNGRPARFCIKTPPKRRGQIARPEGWFNPDRNTWCDVQTWEYVE